MNGMEYSVLVSEMISFNTVSNNHEADLEGVLEINAHFFFETVFLVLSSIILLISDSYSSILIYTAFRNQKLF